jgi:uncharacterized protein
MTEYHESWDALPEPVKDAHRALTSFKEEIEAIDWYHQRVAMAGDPALAAVLAHNRDEEIEHACMMLEWLRRNMPGWDENLRTYLFQELPITEAEARATAASAPQEPAPTAPEGGSGLQIGSLKEKLT